MRTKLLNFLVSIAGVVGLVQSSQALYNPSGGRWLSRDPIREVGGVNLYEFARNNPVQP